MQPDVLDSIPKLNKSKGIIQKRLTERRLKEKDAVLGIEGKPQLAMPSKFSLSGGDAVGYEAAFVTKRKPISNLRRI